VYKNSSLGGDRAKGGDMVKKMYTLYIKTRKKNRTAPIKVSNKDGQKYNGINHNISRIYVY